MTGILLSSSLNYKVYTNMYIYIDAAPSMEDSSRSFHPPRLFCSYCRCDPFALVRSTLLDRRTEREVATLFNHFKA